MRLTEHGEGYKAESIFIDRKCPYRAWHVLNEASKILGHKNFLETFGFGGEGVLGGKIETS